MLRISVGTLAAASVRLPHHDPVCSRRALSGIDAFLISAALALAFVPAALAIPTGWSELPNSPIAGNAQRHDDLWFTSPDSGWVVNGDGEIWHTTDGGTTWTFKTDTGVYNRCITYLPGVRGFVGTLYELDGTALLESKADGQLWVPVDLPAPKPRGLCGLYSVGSHVFGVGAYYGFPRFIHSPDGGVTWTSKDMSPWIGALVDTYFWSPDSGIAVGSTPPGSTRKPRILMTTDGGQSWSIRWTGTRNRELCWKISFVNRQLGYVSIENLSGAGASYFLRTDDGGLTWTEHLFQTSYRNVQGIGFLSDVEGWIGGWEFDTEFTGNGGATWNPAGFGENVNRFRFLSPWLGYACGRRIYRYQVEPSGVADEAPQPIPLLAQNRPNPVTATTEIRFQVRRGGPVRLSLFDLQGREVRVLVNETRAAGDHRITASVEDLPAGTYFYRITTTDGTETRKLLIVR